MAGEHRRRNVLREIRRQQRDPYRIKLKPTTPLCRGGKQPWLPSLAPPARRLGTRLADELWPEHQMDIEEFLDTSRLEEGQ
jgi:hypothetical protein